MNAFTLAIASIRSRPLHAALCTLAVSAGIALLCAVFLFSSSVADGFARNAKGIDMIVGTKGSPLQLVLSSVYHADIPAGNITMEDYESLKRNPRIKQAIPLALGDSYKGFRMVGSTPDYIELYGAEFAEGKVFEASFETVAGVQTGLKIGDKIAVSHGFSADSNDVHDAHLYTITGLLKPTGTVLDKLLITPVESVQQLHAGHDHHNHEEGHDGHDEEHADDHEEHHHDDDHDHEEHEHESHEDAEDHHDHHKEEQAHRDDHEEDHYEHGHDDDHDHEEHAHKSHDHEEGHHEHHHDEDHHHKEEQAHHDDHEEHHDDEHDHEEMAGLEHQVTSVILKVRSPIDLMNMPLQINNSSNLMAAVPSYEMARFTKNLGIGRQLIVVMGAGFVILSSLMLWATLSSGLALRRYDLAVLRVLGATPRRLSATVMAEALLISGVGAVIGVVGGHIIAYCAVQSVEGLNGLVLPEAVLMPQTMDVCFIALGLIAGLLASLVPSISAAKTDIAGLLARGRG